MKKAETKVGGRAVAGRRPAGSARSAYRITTALAEAIDRYGIAAQATGGTSIVPLTVWDERVRRRSELEAAVRDALARASRIPPSQTAAATDNATVTPGNESPCEISDSERGARTGGRR